jgi:phosphatidate cytidylyltransferase
MEMLIKNSMIKRIISAAIMIPLVLAAIYYGRPYMQILAITFGGLLAWEWEYMVNNKRSGIFSIIYAIAMCSSVLLFESVIGMAIILVGTTLITYIKAKDEKERFLLTLGVPYIFFGIGSLVWLHNEVGYALTIWYMISVWCTDIGGMLVGCRLRGPKLAPKISPNKTWSGLFGAMSFAAIFSVCFVYFYGEYSYGQFALLGALLAVVAQMGDLVESTIKRHLNVKDSSNLIPGHGGVFDRVDGLIFAAPIVLVFFKYIF